MDTESSNPRDDYLERFHESAASGDMAKLNIFLKGTIDINATNGKGWTALMYAARNGHLEAVKELVSKGCDAAIMNGSGQTALDIAHFWNHNDIVNFLTSPDADGAGQSTLRMPNQGMTHFFCDNPLDRAAHLRKIASRLKESMKLKTSQFVLLTDLNPYAIQQPDYTAGKLANAYQILRVRYSDISNYLESTNPLVIFLGEEPIANTNDRSAMFAVDSQGLTEEEVKKIQPHAELLSSLFSAMQLEPISAALLAQARPVFAWHERYSFCPTCGAKTFPEEGGYKRTCTNKDCKSLKGIHNTSYPRVDPTVIMAVVSPDNKSLLLGRGKRLPKGMYSCLAGFMEPGESIEDACRRETKEESGISVGRVEYHSCQSWPSPTSLMIGCIAYATSDKIQIDKEELESARWFPRRELVQMLTRQHPDGLFVPPPQAIAHHLIKAWVNMTSNL